jgi:sialate O-acetylesterase
VVTSVNLHAEVRLTNLFTNNMILQHDQPVKLWGLAKKGEMVVVKFCGRQLKGKSR